MAEFKLGRIRFVWKGDWATANTYYQDDVVSFGGKIYICVIGHTSSAEFVSDFNIVPPKWNLVSDGQTWRGDWEPNSTYNLDDIVKYGARLYIANTAHTSAEDSTSGLESNQSLWDIFAEGLDWLGEWQTSYDYKVNDFVRYGGYTYVCNNAHISASTTDLGLEADTGFWDVFNPGVEYKNTWTTGVRYKLNDVVSFGASVYIANSPHTSTEYFADDIANWDTLVDGIQFENEWDIKNHYQPGDIVRYGGNQYISKTPHTGEEPTQNPNTWDLFSEGIRFLGEWGEDSTNQEYKVGELVSYGGYTYLCITDHQNQEPPNPTYWRRLNTGLRWRGQWLDDQEYLLGDIVRFGDNSYVCVLGHISEGDDFSTVTETDPGGGNENSRPDLDTTGVYWNIIAVGVEQSVLTTKGDLVYFSETGPTRLPVGLDGQILSVNADSLPEWTYLGVADDVYYVAEHGSDLPAPVYGRNIDRPWRSIRYACEQIEKGTRNPVAKELLELNRQFIQRETVEWTEYQVTNAIDPFTVDFTFNGTKCERDVGYIVDAIVWDISHGGNVKSREAALEYVNNAAQFYTLGQEAETVASINYALAIMANVLNQTDPDTNYQVTNGDNSTAIVTQYKDSTKNVESGVYTDVTTLVGIITDAITAGVADDIPARLIRNALVKVSTGKYYEVLPIRVPAETCILGDELRSTNVQPRKAANSTLTPKRDAKYSLNALDRVTAVIGDIVTGTSVTPTTGNTETQNTDYPVADTREADIAQQLARTIRRRIDHGLQLKNEAILTKPYDMTTPDYGYGRDLLLENKDFLAAELVAYITSEYPNLKYSRTKCKQDTRFILDALAYDITYGGNWQSTNAGLAYYDGRSGNLQIDSTEKAATLDAYNYLKTLVPLVARDVAISPVLNSVETQVRGAGSTVAVAALTDPLIERIVDIITNGVSAGEDITYPDISAVDQTLLDAYKNLADNLKGPGNIQENTIDFINENFGTFQYNSATCRRDLRNILTDLSFDIVFGTNYNGVFDGLAYRRGYNVYNISNQINQTIGAITYARDLANISLTYDGSTAIGTYTLDDGILDTDSNTYSQRNTASFNELLDILENGAAEADAITYPDPDNLVQNRKDAKDNLVANRQFIIDDVIAYITNQVAANVANPGSIWYQFEYDSTKCARDVGYIVDGLAYDILYQGTHATTRLAQSYFTDAGIIQVYEQEDQTVAAYGHLSSIIQNIVQENLVSAQSGNTTLQTQPGTPASLSEANELAAKVTIITDVLTAGNLDSLPTVVYPTISGEAALDQTAKSNLDSDREDIIRATIQYITNTYDTFVYDHAKCSRDIGLIVDAAAFDWMLGTNYASFVAAYSYLREPSKKVTGNQKTATLAANEYARTLAVQYVKSNATAIAGINDTWQIVQDIIFSGSNEGGLKSVDNFDSFSAIRQLELNKDFIVAEVHAYIDDYYKDTVSAASSVDNSITISDTSWLNKNSIVKFTDAADSALSVESAGLANDTTYYVRQILSDTKFTISATLGGAEISIDDTEATFGVETAYDYSVTTCTRDVTAYIDSIKWDLQYPGNFKREYTRGITQYFPACYETRYSSRYYVNSVLGSQEEDMYYLRNGTGLRLQTLDGLQGDLGPANEFGTSRPTAGAYASLDPGWGTADQRVWITARSPYVQNLTTFGFAATGQKIDGALHDGGNDSIVSNDFTQVISDGIGAHILNNGRAELVSVFTYYSHIGYLAETGGRIRATNGNNSYGTFGSVAEGVDPDETPVTAIVDNRLQYNAVISNVETDNEGLLVFEYSHAGNEYTEVAFDVFGPGDGEAIGPGEFRDDAVFRCRIQDLDDSSGEQGGEGYTVVQNTAQTGSTSSLTLAATDGSTSTAYVGMKLIITGGPGVGQFGIVDTYNSGSKVATVYREIDGLAGWDHFVPGTAIESPTGASTYSIEPNVSFSAPPTDSNQQTLHTTATEWNDIYYIRRSATFEGISGSSTSDGTGCTFNVNKNGSKYFVEVANGGSGYTRLDTITILGSNLTGVTPTNDLIITITAVSVSGEVLQVDFEGFGRSGYYIALNDADDNNNSISPDGESWSAHVLPSSGAGSWFRLADGFIDDGSTLIRPSVAVAVCKDSNDFAYSVGSTDNLPQWTAGTFSGTFSTGGEKDIAFGNNIFVVVGETDRDVLYSVDGVNWQSEALALPSTGYNRVEFGQGVFVAIKAGTSTNAVAYSTDNGLTWTETTLPATETYQDIAFGNNRFIVIASTNNAGAYSIDKGVTWTAVTLPDRDDSSTNAYKRIEYGQGVFIATADNQGVADLEAFSVVYKTEYGLDWEDIPLANTGSISGYNAVGFGNPQRAGKWVISQASSGSTDNVVNLRTGARAKGRAGVASERIFEIRLFEPGSGYFNGAPTITVTDPGNIYDAIFTVRTGVGVLSQPQFNARGADFLEASASVQADNSNGFADFFQDGDFIAVRRLSQQPVNGSNVVFDSLPGTFFKLVNVVSFLGSNDGAYTAFLQVSPQMPVADAPPDGDDVTMRIRFSQVRLTGHDFLDIGTGNFVDSNYPGTPVNDPDPDNETVDNDGGRVFFTATDQDGNFRVGPVFSVEQATGIATLNAEAFNIAGLQELSLGEVTLGGSSASVNEFSTDPFFTANSDSVVPTQRAVKAYIEAQIGGGGASLNVNSVTAGDIFINTNQITTVASETININANLNFRGAILGYPLAYNYFLR